MSNIVTNVLLLALAMKTFRYRLSFTTPAFLGNASQQAQWRTPPVKALLRQWWRVAVAQEMGYCVERLRQRENQLFGTAPALAARLLELANSPTFQLPRQIACIP